MTVTSVDKDVERLTLTLTAEFDAPLERVWELWADPRKLERWWGPPTAPGDLRAPRARPRRHGHLLHDRPGGRARPRRVADHVAVDPPRVAATSRTASPTPTATSIADMPTTDVQMRLTEHDGGTRMELRFAFESTEHMERLERWGAFAVFPQSVGQMDAIIT